MSIRFFFSFSPSRSHDRAVPTAVGHRKANAGRRTSSTWLTPLAWFLVGAVYLYLIIACGGTVRNSAHSAGRPPNIVLILADDLGYGDVGVLNPNSKVPTPNINRLADEGIRYTDAHGPGTESVSSRYGLMTGRYPFRSSLESPVIETGRMTIASLLRREGYVTTMVGNWNLGFQGRGVDIDYSKPLRGGPIDRGFDYFFGVPASTDVPPYLYIENEHAVALPTEVISANTSSGWSPGQGAFWRGGPIAPGLKLEEVLPCLTSRSEEWIENRQKSSDDRPFFLYIALPAPHTPWLPLEEFQGRSGAGMYGDFVMQVDDALGRILGVLDRSGFRESTLVFFTSDNGPVWYSKDVERFGHNSAYIYRGMKGDVWEGGHRVPFIARWPGQVKACSVGSETICLTDVLATFAELVGVDLPDDAGEDSFSILPSLLGRSTGEPVREVTIFQSAQGTLAMREGNWKLIPALGGGGLSQPKTETSTPGGPQGQLYNLAADPSETTNRWSAMPEVVKRLTTLLEAHQTCGRTRPPTRRTPP